MIDSFQLLTDTDLNALAMALRSGRLTPPFTVASVGRCSAASSAVLVSDRLQLLSDEGLAPRHIALLVDMILQTRLRQTDEIDLVWTGPEVPGTANRDTGVVVRELFSSARESVLVAGYSIHQGRGVFRSLADRMAAIPCLSVRLFLDVQRPHQDTTPAEALLAKFARRFREKEWPGDTFPHVFHDPRSLELDTQKRSSLHAKCVVVDREVAFVSSANFTEAAQVRNIEAGVLIRSPMFANRLAQHFETLATAGILLPVSIGV